MESRGLSYSADDIIREFIKFSNAGSLFNFMEKQISRLKLNGNIRTSETYQATLSSFRKFRKEDDIMLDLSLFPALDFARDMFVISFMLRGMSFVDMAYLRKKDLMNGYVVYRRRKTGQQLTISWTKEMQAILDKYPPNTSEYLLPIIRNPCVNELYAYRNVSYNINRALKTIGRMVGLKLPLTLYVARHSWASAAKTKGIPISVISEGMGHESETTTRIYLASLDTSIVDKANALILKSI